MWCVFSLYSSVVVVVINVLCNTGELSIKMEGSALKLVMDASAKSFIVLKSDNFQYDTLGRWVVRRIDQASDGPSIIFID